MQMTPVESRSLAAIGYDPETHTLGVEFKTGSYYRYFGVLPRIYEELMAADSRGA